MERRGIQVSIRGMLVLVACVAINIWCFKISGLLGLVAINLTKHVLIAQLCQACGVNRRGDRQDGKVMAGEAATGLAGPMSQV